MNKFLFTLILLCLSILGEVSVVAQLTVVDRIVAVVGKEPILLSDLNAQVEFYTLNNRVDSSTPGLKQQVLDAMVNEKLMLASAQEDTNIAVREEDITNQLEALIAQRIQQVGSEQRLAELYGMPISRIKREFRDETRKQLMVQMLQQSKFGNIQVSRREVEEFFSQYKDSLPAVPEEVEVYHIFKVPSVSITAKNAIRTKAQHILDSIRAGGDFADFARRYSEDRATATSGGDLGSWHRGQFVAEFEEAVFSLKEGDLSNVVETSRGFHIVQLLERRGDLVHARQILFKVGLDTAGVQETKALLRSLKDSVLNRQAMFADIAKRHSDDKETAPLGGYLGEYPLTQLDKSLQDVVKDLKEGEISEPMEVSAGTTSTGYQVVYVKKRVPEHAMNIQNDWKRIEQLAMQFKRTNEYQKWIKELRSEIYWDIRL
ncbi:MAG: peptidylprolyl isomerase [Ignavibacteriae bacterium]|nr:peptidylprolyl isomerase [Ignavibacteria bacterium]MBI3365046.1 peptidylprolyl isomerase [Ignavibacteriota bacterium]